MKMQDVINCAVMAITKPDCSQKERLNEGLWLHAKLTEIDLYFDQVKEVTEYEFEKGIFTSKEIIHALEHVLSRLDAYCEEKGWSFYDESFYADMEKVLLNVYRNFVAYRFSMHDKFKWDITLEGDKKCMCRICVHKGEIS